MRIDQAAAAPAPTPLVGVKKGCHGRLLISRRPRQCRTLRGPRDHTHVPRVGAPHLVAGEVVLLLLIALRGALLACKWPPALTCLSLVLEASRRRGARTPPGPVVPLCDKHAPTRGGAAPSRRRSMGAHSCPRTPRRE